MPKKKDAKWWRDYRSRKRARKSGLPDPVPAPMPVVPLKRRPNGGVAPRKGKCPSCGNERYLQTDHIVPRSKGGGGEPSNIQYICADCHQDKSQAELLGAVVLAGPVAAQIQYAQSKKPTPPRRVRMKSDEQIRGAIAMAIRQYHMQPKALVHVISGYVVQLQEDMKHDTEDQFAERACSGRHPGRGAQGVYCKLCHDAEMASKFGALPGGGPRPDLNFPGDELAPGAPAGLSGDELDDLDNITIRQE